MKTFAIMQDAGSQVRVGEIDAADEWSALYEYVEGRYIESENQQFRGYRLEWASGATWRPDDGRRRPGRRWRVTVTLANGSYMHEIHLQAWAV